MNNVFRLVNPVYDRNPYIFKVDVFTKQVKYEENTVFLLRPAYSTCRVLRTALQVRRLSYNGPRTITHTPPQYVYIDRCGYIF